ncbi:hypothetical protein [Rossellomorea marisflavi]|uniref:hypothetical protein n=1 Tax=Rossellomorea marisflavi TaxID=189381 RepID=UPI003F9F64E9
MKKRTAVVGLLGAGLLVSLLAKKVGIVKVEIKPEQEPELPVVEDAKDVAGEEELEKTDEDLSEAEINRYANES